MADTTNFKLVDGIFNSEDARDILCHILNKKINFHNDRLFSLDERFGIEDQHSKKRVQELRTAKAEILDLIEQAEAMGLRLEVRAGINISFTTKPATSKETATITKAL